MKEIYDLFNKLESNEPQVVDNVKKELHTSFNSTKDSWILNGLYDYFVQTSSMRSVEIIASVREPHDKYFFDRVDEGLKQQNKIPALTLFGHIVRRQPPWIYKVTKHGVFKNLLKLLKTETEIQPLMSGLLILITLLPVVPAYIGPSLNYIFEIFGRLASWNGNPGKLEEEQLVHLQIGMYALFLKLYGMYPCNFLSYLRKEYALRENLAIFSHTIKPMLSTVKMHPLLVTSSKDAEISTERWKKTSYHDIIVDCERLTLDPYDKTFEESNMSVNNFRSRASTGFLDTNNLTLSQTIKSKKVVTLQKDDLTNNSSAAGFFSPGFYFQHNSQSPPIQDNIIISTSVPQTPNTTPVITSNYLNQEGTSPPEAAVEATPDTTPKNLNLHFASKIPSHSVVTRALNNLWPDATGVGVLPTSSNSTSLSQPSSPRRKDISFRLSADSSRSAFESNRNEMFDFKPTTTVSGGIAQQRLKKLMNERCMSNEGLVERTVRTPMEKLIRTTGPSPHQFKTTNDNSVPNSPVPVDILPSGYYASSMHIDIKEWPHQVVKPKAEKNGLKYEPLTETNNQQEITSQEDKEVDEIVSYGQKFAQKYNHHQQINLSNNSTTPSVIQPHCDSVLQVYHPPHNEDFEECDFHAMTSSGGAGGGSNQGGMSSSCSSGGLHMPNSQSMRDMQKKIRMRFYSVTDTSNTDVIHFSSGSSPGDCLTNIEQHLLKVRRANSCPEMKKGESNGCMDVTNSVAAGVLQEMDELEMNETQLLNRKSHRKKYRDMIILDKRKETKCLRSISCQTVEAWPQPYEHLFVNVFGDSSQSIYNIHGNVILTDNVQINQYQIGTNNKVVNSSQGCNNCCSKPITPNEILYKYLEGSKTISIENQCLLPSFSTNSTTIVDTSQGPVQRSRTRSFDTEIRILKEQLELVYLQLQYERYRREVHAERNRRLSGKAKNNKSCEDHNSALQDQLALLQQDFECMKFQMDEQNKLFIQRKNELDLNLDYYKNQCLQLQEENKTNRQKLEMLETQLHDRLAKYNELEIDLQQNEAMLFDLRNELNGAVQQAMLGDQLRADLKYFQKKLVILGELQLKLQEKHLLYQHLQFKHIEMDKLTETYIIEVEGLNQQLVLKNSMLESSRARILELEQMISRHDEVQAQQKRMLKMVKEEYQEQLNAVESKYRTQCKIIKRMEEQMLDLFTKIDRYELGIRRGIRSPDSHSSTSGSRDITSSRADGTSNSGHNNVSGATANTTSQINASGILATSPHNSSPPLSVSLTSSEGGSSMAFLPSAAAITSDMEMKNLQVIIDQSQCEQAQSSSTELSKN